MRELGSDMPGARFAGLGLARMREAGLESVRHDADMAVMGYWDALAKLPGILRVRRALVRSMTDDLPSLFVGIDSPDFNFGVERILKDRGVKVAHIVSPSLWAWRPERIEKIRRSMHLMLCLFPFEEKIYRDAGVRAAVIGHPDADRAPEVPDRAAARSRIGLRGDADPVVTLMPGSRAQEIEHHLDAFLEAAGKIAERHPDAAFLIPAANETCRAEIARRGAAERPGVDVHLPAADAADCLEASDFAVVKSGTSTLQAMLYGVPMVIAYIMSPIAYRLVRLRKFHTRFVGLPNVLAGKRLCAELIQERATPANIADEAERLLGDPESARRYRDEAMAIRATLRMGAGRRAAAALKELASGDGD